MVNIIQQAITRRKSFDYTSALYQAMHTLVCCKGSLLQGFGYHIPTNPQRIDALRDWAYSQGSARPCFKGLRHTAHDMRLYKIIYRPTLQRAIVYHALLQRISVHYRAFTQKTWHYGIMASKVQPRAYNEAMRPLWRMVCAPNSTGGGGKRDYGGVALNTQLSVCKILRRGTF
jgi:hypothetical protein